MEQQIIDKANYCLNCINKRCSTKGCPMHTKIPEYISMIKEPAIIDENVFRVMTQDLG